MLSYNLIDYNILIIFTENVEQSYIHIKLLIRSPYECIKFSI